MTPAYKKYSTFFIKFCWFPSTTAPIVIATKCGMETLNGKRTSKDRRPNRIHLESGFANWRSFANDACLSTFSLAFLLLLLASKREVESSLSPSSSSESSSEEDFCDLSSSSESSSSDDMCLSNCFLL